MHSFMAIFPNKTRVFFVRSKEEKNMWIQAIKKVVVDCVLTDFYELGSVIGQGKFGVVRLGVHKISKREVAVKLVKKKNLSQNDLLLQIREIEMLKLCQHPSIIELYDVFESIDQIEIVMEIAKGGDLFSYLQARNFIVSEQRAKDIIHQLATAVFYLQSLGIVHRDIKPENIMMKNK